MKTFNTICNRIQPKFQELVNEGLLTVYDYGFHNLAELHLRRRIRKATEEKKNSRNLGLKFVLLSLEVGALILPCPSRVSVAYRRLLEDAAKREIRDTLRNGKKQRSEKPRHASSYHSFAVKQTEASRIKQSSHAGEF